MTFINVLHFYLEAKETDLSVADVEEAELWDISYFEDYKNVILCNKKGKREITDMKKWKKEHRKA